MYSSPSKLVWKRYWNNTMGQFPDCKCSTYQYDVHFNSQKGIFAFDILWVDPCKIFLLDGSEGRVCWLKIRSSRSGWRLSSLVIWQIASLTKNIQFLTLIKMAACGHISTDNWKVFRHFLRNYNIRISDKPVIHRESESQTKIKDL